jgi:Bifunctional DNA primase/polymerase, N-terminal
MLRQHGADGAGNWEPRPIESFVAQAQDISADDSRQSGDEQRYPYRDGAPLYLARGWCRPLPLHKGKGVVPKGFTGNHGVDPTPEQIDQWRATKGDHNICLCVPENVIGLDVDHYDNKRGGDTLAHADTLWEPRPTTVRSTSRDDGVSGIRLYRIPPGTPKLAGEIKLVLDAGTVLAHVEIVQHHHRNVNCWPTLHAKTRRIYQWLDDDDNVVGIPCTDELPMLPARWVEELVGRRGGGSRRPPGVPRTPREQKAMDAAQVAALEKALTLGGMSWKVMMRLESALAELTGLGCRYDSMVANTLALLRYGYDGQPGVEHALEVYRQRYREEVGDDRDGGAYTADGEFERAVRGAGALLIVDLSFDPFATVAPPADSVVAALDGYETDTCVDPPSIDGAEFDGYETNPCDTEDGL